MVCVELIVFWIVALFTVQVPPAAMSDFPPKANVPPFTTTFPVIVGPPLPEYVSFPAPALTKV